MIDIKRCELLLNFMVAGVRFVVTSGFTSTENRKKLKILVLGGTGFTGSHIVHRALALGNEITISIVAGPIPTFFPRIKLVGDLDSLAWHRQLPQNKQAFTRAGIDPQKEAEIPAAWHRHQLAVSGSS